MAHCLLNLSWLPQELNVLLDQSLGPEVPWSTSWTAMGDYYVYRKRTASPWSSRRPIFIRLALGMINLVQWLMKYRSHVCLRSSTMKAFFVVIVTVTITSILWASFRNALDPNLTSEDVPTRLHRTEGEWPRLNGDPDNIFWMVQVGTVGFSA